MSAIAFKDDSFRFSTDTNPRSAPLAYNSNAVNDWAKSISNHFGGEKSQLQAIPDGSLLSQKRLDLKKSLASISWHLSFDVRTLILKRLDQILEEDEWHTDDQLPDLASWNTFLRMTVYSRPKKVPGITFHNGSTIAYWDYKDIRVTIECMKDDRIKWTASKLVEGEREISAGEALVKRLAQVLSAYNEDSWLYGSNPAS